MFRAGRPAHRQALILHLPCFYSDDRFCAAFLPRLLLESLSIAAVKEECVMELGGRRGSTRLCCFHLESPPSCRRVAAHVANLSAASENSVVRL